jgi:hypothetical protein
MNTEPPENKTFGSWTVRSWSQDVSKDIDASSRKADTELTLDEEGLHLSTDEGSGWERQTVHRTIPIAVLLEMLRRKGYVIGEPAYAQPSE